MYTHYCVLNVYTLNCLNLQTISTILNTIWEEDITYITITIYYNNSYYNNIYYNIIAQFP